MTDPDQNAPVPPAGYTAEELERDNPHNAWMNDMSLETSEAAPAPQAEPTDEEIGHVTIEQARAALDSMDDFARMKTGVDAMGPRRTLEVFIAQAEAVRAAPAPQAGGEQAPIDMVLHCPACHMQHIDAPDQRTADWKNDPHRSHLCRGCGHIWRPADVPTNGVAAVKTFGKNDSPIAAQTSVQLECLVDFVARVTHWAEGGATRHDAILALKQLGVWK